MKKNIEIEVPEGYTLNVRTDEGGKQTICFVPVEKKDEAAEKADEPWQPKEGDAVAYSFRGGNLNIGIFRKSSEHTPEGYSQHKDYVTIGGDSGKLYFWDPVFIQDYIRPATDEEKQRLFDALAKEGKRWNAEKKQIEDLPRWRAREDEKYYYIGVDSEVEDDVELGCEGDNACYSVGNYFKTKEAAERVAKQIREIFKNSKEE